MSQKPQSAVTAHYWNQKKIKTHSDESLGRTESRVVRPKLLDFHFNFLPSFQITSVKNSDWIFLSSTL